MKNFSIHPPPPHRLELQKQTSMSNHKKQSPHGMRTKQMVYLQVEGSARPPSLPHFEKGGGVGGMKKKNAEIFPPPFSYLFAHKIVRKWGRSQVRGPDPKRGVWLRFWKERVLFYLLPPLAFRRYVGEFEKSK